MYTIISDSISLGEFNSIIFIKLAENGCYNECLESSAEGICVKLPKEYNIEDEEGNIQTIQTLADTVFRLNENGLKGDEPICTIVKM